VSNLAGDPSPFTYQIKGRAKAYSNTSIIVIKYTAVDEIIEISGRPTQIFMPAINGNLAARALLKVVNVSGFNKIVALSTLSHVPQDFIIAHSYTSSRNRDKDCAQHAIRRYRRPALPEQQFRPRDNRG
jgi:hypothetical protein